MSRPADCVLAFASLMFLALWAAPPSSAASETDRFERLSVLPFVDVQPGFTTEPRQDFHLDLGGLGRRPIEVLAVKINDRILPRSAWVQRLSTLVIRPAHDLRTGLNRVTIEYNHPVDRVHRREANPIAYTAFVNHQRSPGQIKLGTRGELIVSGERKFIRGGYRSGQSDRFLDALPSAAKAGFNLVHDYKFESFDVKRLGVDEFLKQAKLYLRRAHDLGLGVFLGLPRTAVREYDEETLATIVAELSGEPALWLWYIYDEPYPTVISVENASKVYSLLRRLDPGRPSVIVTNRIDAMTQYHPFCDILWYDRYPFFGTSKELSALAPIAAAIQKSLTTVGSGKPVWPVLQAHDNKANPSVRKRSFALDKPSDASHWPGEKEMRAQAHVALAQGVMSVIYYWAPETWYSMATDTPGIWKSLSRVVRELREIEPILLSYEAPTSLSIRGGHNKTMTWQRRYENADYVGIVNGSIHDVTELVLRTPEERRVRKLIGDGEIEPLSDGVRVKLNGAGVVVLLFE